MAAIRMNIGSASRPVIGLTGGIGSGKSLVASMLRELGCEVIDGDQIGHEVRARPEIVARLVERFDSDILDDDGAISRRRLGEKAFADAESLRQLNAIMHPAIRAEIQRRIERFRRSHAPAVVLDAALLLETDWHELCDVLVFVDAPASRRRIRLAETRGWSGAEMAKRENHQKPLDKKRASSDHIVENKSSVSHLRRQVHLLFQSLVNPAAGT